MGKELLLCKYNYDGLGHCALSECGAKEYCVEGPCKACEYVRYKVALRAERNASTQSFLKLSISSNVGK